MFQGAEFWAGAQADFGDQGVAGLVVSGQGVGSAAGTVEGEHETGVEAFAQGVFGGQGREFGYQVGVAACRQVGVYAAFEQGHA
ncbi:hypothetical protein GCM10023080_062380 [Streptomyces pseudoechinosporeus]